MERELIAVRLERSELRATAEGAAADLQVVPPRVDLHIALEPGVLEGVRVDVGIARAVPAERERPLKPEERAVEDLVDGVGDHELALVAEAAREREPRRVRVVHAVEHERAVRLGLDAEAIDAADAVETPLDRHGVVALGEVPARIAVLVVDSHGRAVPLAVGVGVLLAVELGVKRACGPEAQARALGERVLADVDRVLGLHKEALEARTAVERARADLGHGLVEVDPLEGVGAREGTRRDGVHGRLHAVDGERAAERLDAPSLVGEKHELLVGAAIVEELFGVVDVRQDRLRIGRARRVEAALDILNLLFREAHDVLHIAAGERPVLEDEGPVVEEHDGVHVRAALEGACLDGVRNLHEARGGARVEDADELVLGEDHAARADEGLVRVGGGGELDVESAFELVVVLLGEVVEDVVVHDDLAVDEAPGVDGGNDPVRAVDANLGQGVRGRDLDAFDARGHVELLECHGNAQVLGSGLVCEHAVSGGGEVGVALGDLVGVLDREGPLHVDVDRGIGDSHRGDGPGVVAACGAVF